MAKAINTKTLVNVAKPDLSGLVTIIATGKAVSMKKDTEHKVTMTLAETLVNKGFATFKK
jgi:hypothetical protein